MPRSNPKKSRGARTLTKRAPSAAARITAKQRAAQDRVDALTQRATPATPERLTTRRADAERDGRLTRKDSETLAVAHMHDACVATGERTADAPTLEQVLKTLGPKRTETARRYAEKARREAWTWAALDVEQLGKVVRAAGVPVAAAIWRVSEAAIRAAAGAAPTSHRIPVPVGSPNNLATHVRTASTARHVAPAPVIEKATMPAPKRALVDDMALAVALSTLAPGTAFKTPDSPAEGLAGIMATLIHVNACRAHVKLGATRAHVVTHVNGEDIDREFERPGRAVDWASSTLVIPIAAPAVEEVAR